MRKIFLSGISGVKKTVRTGECDISAAASSEKRDERKDKGTHIARVENTAHSVPYRRFGFDRHIENYDDHDTSKVFCQLIHAGLRVLGEEDQDSDDSRDKGSNRRRYSEQYVESQGTASDISDVECQTAKRNHECDKIPEPRKDFICNILSAHAGHTDHRPDIQLCRHIQQDRADDHQRENTFILSRKCGSLCQEARSDRGCRHQERSSHQGRHVAVFFLFPHK